MRVLSDGDILAGVKATLSHPAWDGKGMGSMIGSYENDPACNAKPSLKAVCWSRKKRRWVHGPKRPIGQQGLTLSKRAVGLSDLAPPIRMSLRPRQRAKSPTLTSPSCFPAT